MVRQHRVLFLSSPRLPRSNARASSISAEQTASNSFRAERTATSTMGSARWRRVRLQHGCCRTLLLSKRLIAACRSSPAPCKRGPWGTFTAFLKPRQRMRRGWTQVEGSSVHRILFMEFVYFISSCASSTLFS